MLITLGIIGIVAAMTMPTLITNHQKQVTVTRLKKTYSVLSNIVKMSENYNGEMSQWEFPQKTHDLDEAVTFLNKYYAPYAQSAKVYPYSELHQQGYQMSNLTGKPLGNITAGMTLADGSLIIIFPNIANGYIWLFADINGFQKPNRIGRDIFVLDTYKNDNGGKYALRFWGASSNLDVLTKNPDIPEEEIESNKGYYACNKNNIHGYYSGFYCGAVIQKNGWQMPPDYPW